jgi:hypothetical protein
VPPILTPEDIVHRIAAECAYVDERGGVGIRPEPAAAIVRRYGGQFRRAPRRERMRRSARVVSAGLNFFLNGGGSRQAEVSGSAKNSQLSRCRRTAQIDPKQSLCRSTASSADAPKLPF